MKANPARFTILFFVTLLLYGHTTGVDAQASPPDNTSEACQLSQIGDDELQTVALSLIDYLWTFQQDNLSERLTKGKMLLTKDANERSTEALERGLELARRTKRSQQFLITGKTEIVRAATQNYAVVSLPGTIEVKENGTNTLTEHLGLDVFLSPECKPPGKTVPRVMLVVPYGSDPIPVQPILTPHEELRRQVGQLEINLEDHRTRAAKVLDKNTTRLEALTMKIDMLESRLKALEEKRGQ